LRKNAEARGGGPSGGAQCIEGFEQCYDFDHIVQLKKHGISDLL
jgi:hypothetical protein